MSEKPSSKIVVTVVSGLILAGLLFIFKSYLPAFLKWIWNGVVACWLWLLGAHEVPGWAIVILSIALLLIFAAAIQYFTQKRPARGPNWRDFTEANLFGFCWRWDYDTRGNITNVHTFCPDGSCDMQVFPKTDYDMYGRDRTKLACDRCGMEKILNDDPRQLELKVRLEIQRLLRTGQWIAGNSNAQQDVHGNAN